MVLIAFNFPIWYQNGCEPLQRTHLQWPLLKMSSTAGDKTSRGRNPENGRRRDFGRRQHQQSGFQYTDRPWSSSPELFNKDHNAGHEILSHLIFTMLEVQVFLSVISIYNGDRSQDHPSHKTTPCILYFVVCFQSEWMWQVLFPVRREYFLSILQRDGSSTSKLF